MHQRTAWFSCVTCILFTALTLFAPRASGQDANSGKWTWRGWGGGGFFYAAAFHPTKDGVIYLAGDVNGVYKSEDHGKNWRIINNGIVDYGVFSLAVDPRSPDTVYAATEGGLCKSTDAGEHWTLLPNTEKKNLRITGEKGKSIRCIAVDPASSNILYAGSPGGKIFKSTDAGQTWSPIYEKTHAAEAAEVLRVQYGRSNGAIFGGIWMPVKFPETISAADAVGFGFSFKPEGPAPRDVFLTLKTSTGVSYRSKNLSDEFSNAEMHDVVLTGSDFILDPEFKSKNPDKAASSPATPDWSTVNRLDLACVGNLDKEASIARISKFFFAAKRTSDGQTGTDTQPVLVTTREFSQDKKIQSYGNVRLGTPAAGPVLTVAVSPHDSNFLAAATADSGLLLSNDAGKTWREVSGPKRATSVAFSASDSNVIYTGFGTDGIWKSTDKGQTWANSSAGIESNLHIKDVAVSPRDPQDVYAIGTAGWNGQFYYSNDGGQSWQKSSQLKPDLVGNPTLPAESDGGKTVGLSNPTNLVINPKNPQQLYISANWRNAISEDGGKSWNESSRGADISCITDIRFHKDRVYVSAMDEGVLASDDNGALWKQLWPMRYTESLSGHYWRLAITSVNGNDRIISTSSPWVDKFNNQVVLSEDGGKTFKIARTGLPNYVPVANTMWGRGYARALAVDPNNPKVVYLGIDGDPSDGKSGGGLFKSEDGGNTWKQLANQPGSRRMFFALAVDPTNSKRLYWGACNTNGGLYRSEDGGESWELVYKGDQWVFNVVVAADGTVYCPGKNLFRSKDNGKTWQQLTKFTNDRRTIVAMEMHPTDPKTMWITATTWDGSHDGAVYETTDAGATWKDITGDLPYRKPMVLRFNPKTNELWAGGVGLYTLKR